MQTITSYKVKIKEYNNIFEDTLKIYREALVYLIKTVNIEWENISEIKKPEYRQKYIEEIIHGTSRREAKYDFDRKFYKYPTYLRRAAVRESIGHVQSYRKKYEIWENGGKKNKPPTLQRKHFSYPALFKDNMYIREGDYAAKIKIYHRNDWVWLKVNLRKSDVDYITKHKSTSETTVPTLRKDGKNWHLQFAFVDRVKLGKESNIITAVKLGINNAATCSAILPNGTVTGRKIIAFPVEQDRMGHRLNKIRKAQQHGAKRTPRLWAYVNNCNRTLSEKTAKAVVEFARLYNSDVIVFEHLEIRGRKYGANKQKLHMWRRQSVINTVTCKAHLFGMRVSTVNGRNTGKLAFDGSGKIKRNRSSYTVCAFQTGKHYHSDLNASYNIGARYYIREQLKSLPETARLAAWAKVPALARRTTCVLSDLISLNAEFMRFAV